MEEEHTLAAVALRILSYNIRYFGHALRGLASTQGLPTTTRVHDLRHGAATYLLAAGVNSRVVMSIMGWSQVSMLARYQHVLDSMLTDAAQRLEAHLELCASLRLELGVSER